MIIFYCMFSSSVTAEGGGEVLYFFLVMYLIFYIWILTVSVMLDEERCDCILYSVFF